MIYLQFFGAATVTANVGGAKKQYDAANHLAQQMERGSASHPGNAQAHNEEDRDALTKWAKDECAGIAEHRLRAIPYFATARGSTTNR